MSVAVPTVERALAPIRSWSTMIAAESRQLPLRDVQADVAQVVLARSSHLDRAPIGDAVAVAVHAETEPSRVDVVSSEILQSYIRVAATDSIFAHCGVPRISPMTSSRDSRGTSPPNELKSRSWPVASTRIKGGPVPDRSNAIRVPSADRTLWEAGLLDKVPLPSAHRLWRPIRPRARVELIGGERPIEEIDRMAGSRMILSHRYI